MEEGEQRELYTADMDHPVYVESFTVPQAARALGRSELCLKRWIQEGIVPAPILKDTVRNYNHYSAGELQVIARVLRRHEIDFKYLTAKHTATIHALWRGMQAYRATRV